MTFRRSAPTALVAALVVLAACGSDDSGANSDNTVRLDTPIVVATTSIWADITTNVACNGLAQVLTIIPPGGDPHSFEPSLRDRETMDSADLVVANGLFLEESLADTIDAAESNGVSVLRVGEELDPLPIGEKSHDDEPETSDGDDHDDDYGDDYGGGDPHVWWDPTRVAAAVPLIADALADAGVDRAALDACAAQYVGELTTLDEEVATIVAPMPVDQRILVTNHDSLGYFAKRYEFEVLGSVIPSSSSLAATSPAELDDLADQIGATGVPAIFADTQNSSTDADALANRLGGVDVVSMLTDTLDEPGTEGGTYVGWLSGNARTIIDALTRSGAN